MSLYFIRSWAPIKKNSIMMNTTYMSKAWKFTKLWNWLDSLLDEFVNSNVKRIPYFLAERKYHSFFLLLLFKWMSLLSTESNWPSFGCFVSVIEWYSLRFFHYYHLKYNTNHSTLYLFVTMVKYSRVVAYINIWIPYISFQQIFCISIIFFSLLDLSE